MNKKKKNEEEMNEQTELRKKIHEVYEQNELDSLFSMRHRARSITVGTAFGGICEISMRTENNYMYAQIQPIEVVELIEQLAAGIGVEIAMRPKKNFASWRGWEEVIDQRIGWDRIAWKGSAAWQLNGNQLEENLKRLEGTEEKKSLPESKSTSKTRKRQKTEQKVQEKVEENE